MDEDKRYRECVSEIAGILQKYDMAGAVTVVSKERAMFRYVFPTWSCISLEGDKLRFRAHHSEFPNKQAQRDTVELSAHIIMQMRDIAAQTFAMCEQIGNALREKVGMEHEPFQDFDPEREN